MYVIAFHDLKLAKNGEGTVVFDIEIAAIFKPTFVFIFYFIYSQNSFCDHSYMRPTLVTPPL